MRSWHLDVKFLGSDALIANHLSHLAALISKGYPLVPTANRRHIIFTVFSLLNPSSPTPPVNLQRFANVAYAHSLSMHFDIRSDIFKWLSEKTNCAFIVTSSDCPSSKCTPHFYCYRKQAKTSVISFILLMVLLIVKICLDLLDLYQSTLEYDHFCRS